MPLFGALPPKTRSAVMPSQPPQDAYTRGGSGESVGSSSSGSARLPTPMSMASSGMSTASSLDGAVVSYETSGTTVSSRASYGRLRTAMVLEPDSPRETSVSFGFRSLTALLPSEVDSPTEDEDMPSYPHLLRRGRSALPPSGGAGSFGRSRTAMLPEDFSPKGGQPMPSEEAWFAAPDRMDTQREKMSL
jgi:hypothetical protein